MSAQDDGKPRIDTDALLATVDLLELAQSYLPDLKKRGREYVCPCPFHGERTASFCVVTEKEFCHCFGCGWHGTAIDLVMQLDRVDFLTACESLGAKREVTPADRPARPARPPEPERVTRPPPVGEPLPDIRLRTLGAPTRSWQYLDASGALLGIVARYEYRNADGETKKEIRQWTWGSTDGANWRWDCLHWMKPRPLYGLDRLAARPEAAALFSEGEKATDAAAILSAYVNMGWPGGTQAVKHVDWSPMKGRRAVLWPDFDTQTFKATHPWVRAGRAQVGQAMPARLQPGYLAMMDVAAALWAVGCTEIQVIVPRDNDIKGDGWDLYDAVHADKMSRKDIEKFARDRILRAWKPPSPECGCGATLTGEEIEYYDGTCERCETLAQANRQEPEETQPAVMAPAPEEVMQAGTGRKQADSFYPPANPPPSNPPAGGARRLAVVGGTDGNAALKTHPRASDLPPEYSDDAISLEFTKQHGGELKFVAAWEAWVRWTGARWARDETLDSHDMARTICRKMARDAAMNGTLPPAQQRTLPKSLASAASVSNVLKLARSHRDHSASPIQWDTDPWLLNTPGGVVDLVTGRLRPARANDLMMKMTESAPGGECPTWLSFLETVTDGDTEIQSFLQRVAGYSLTGSVREPALIFAHGGGGNGKGVFINTLQWILGDYARTAPISTFMDTKGDPHPTDVAGFVGKRLIVAQETDEGRRWAEAKVKMLTGGDKLTARFMGEDFFDYQPQFKLLISGNNKPALRNVDAAIRRRFYLVPFEVQIKNPDVTLGDKLRAEAAGILAWCVRGCLDWQRAGLSAPTSIRMATDAYLSDQDTFGDWLLECTEGQEGELTPAGNLYRSFKRWANERNEPELTARRFGELLGNRRIDKTRDARGVWSYIGIKLRSEFHRNYGGPMFDD